MPKPIAEWLVVMMAALLVWALVAPIVATAGRNEQARHDCPKLKVTHGVGSDLRTFKKAVDLCAHR